MNRYIVCIGILISATLLLGEVEASGIMRVHFIDVGQGDSVLIETPENQTILIDGGGGEAGKAVVTYIQNQGIKKLDWVIATHPHEDHIGGLIEVLEKFPVTLLIDNGESHWTKTFLTYRYLVRKKEIPKLAINQSKSMAIETDIYVDFYIFPGEKENHNQASLVTKITYDEIDILLLSDVEKEQEKYFAKMFNVQAEIVKIAHHGSKTSSATSFLREVAPKTAIITYGRDNSYGHPVPQVIRRLNRINAMIYSTAGYGSLTMETDGSDYLIVPASDPLERLAR